MEALMKWSNMEVKTFCVYLEPTLSGEAAARCELSALREPVRRTSAARPD